MTKSRNLIAPRRAWTAVELELLRRNYPDSRTDDLAAALDRTLTTVYQKAIKMGLRKSEAYLATDNACRIQRGRQSEAMKASQFKPGQASWNKGLRGVVGVQEACRATQFKKGRPANEARNYLPIGSLRISKDGYLERKVTDDPSVYPARRWVAVHRLVWLDAHGPVPDGHVVIFKPGMRTTVEAEVIVDRLDLVTRQELMRRNSVHTVYPPEVARLVQLNGALKRQINKRARNEQNAE